MKSKKNNIVLIGAIISTIIGLVMVFTSTYFLTKKENEKNNEEINKYPAAIALDSIISKVEFNLTEQSKLDLISSSSCEGCMSYNLVGSMFNENISNEYKFIYTLSEATWNAFDYDYEKMQSNYGFVVSLEKKTIEKLGNQLFTDFKIPTKITDETWYYGIRDISCTKDKCYYTYNTFSLIGLTTNGYEMSTKTNSNKITANIIYIQYENERFKNPDSEETPLIATIYLHQNHNETHFKKIKDHTFKSQQYEYDPIIYNEFSKYYDTTDSYTYEFTKDNRLISVKKN